MQPQVLTNEVSEITKTSNDINQPNMSLGLGSSSPVQNLDKEDPMLAGAALSSEVSQQQEQKEEDNQGSWLREIEKLQQENEKLKQLHENPLVYGMSGLKGYDREEIDKLIAANEQRIYDIKNNGKFDNRTDEQRREDKYIEEERDRLDSSYQRTVADMKKAGLNPMFMQGTNSAGSIGQMGGSKSETEEEKKKRRRAELKAQEEERKRLSQKETQMILGFITSMAETAAKAVGK